MQRAHRALVGGAIGGCLGTSAMSIVMVAGQKLGVLGGQPPSYVAGAGLDVLGLRRTGKEQAALAVVLHVVFGSASGALFGLLSPRLHTRLAPRLQGVFFGALVWGLSYKGWIPALGIMPPPEQDHPGRPLVMLLAHGVYGLVLGAYAGQDSREEEPRPRMIARAPGHDAPGRLHR